MKFFLDKGQQQKMQTMLEARCRAFDDWRGPGVHKFHAAAHVQLPMVLHFAGAKPATIEYARTNLGAFSVVQTGRFTVPYDVARADYDFPTLDRFLQTSASLRVEVQFHNDGLVCNWTVVLFVGNRKMDLSSYRIS